MVSVKGFEAARGILGNKPWFCPNCGQEVPIAEHISHVTGGGCVEILKEQKANLERQLAEAQARIRELEGQVAVVRESLRREIHG